MPITKDQILAALPLMDKADLKAVYLVTQTLLGDAGTVLAETPTGWLCEALASTTGASTVSFTQGLTGKAFTRNAPVFLEFVNKHFKESMKRKTTALSVMRFLLKLIKDDLKEPTARKLVMNLHFISDVFNRAFPGYLDGQAAKFIEATLM